MSPNFVPFREIELKHIITPYITSPFVLLETASFDSENRKSFLFFSFYDFLILKPQDNLNSFFDKLESYLKRGFWVVGFFSYELGYFLEPVLYKFAPRDINFPLIWVGICREPYIFSHRTHKFFCSYPQKKSGLNYKVGKLVPNITKRRYFSCIQRIKKYIEKGETYQVNFTFKYKFGFQGDVLGFYLNLRRSQPTSYMAFINTGREHILSFSPELFFRLNNNDIKVRPMKGTISRGYLLDEDKKRGIWIRNDIKNRAENVMIVDLLRNDLGRISILGSVKVEKLFEVERYRTLHQMTSTIKSSLIEGLTFKEMFSALFPSGSVTGAPKIRTMEIIRELENEPRNIYTGAIGYISPAKEACFNVAIRTILLREGKGEMGVGGGIVYDSEQNLEHNEAKLKANFLIKKYPRFSLVESLCWKKGEGFTFLDLHLRRLENSAFYFQIPLNLSRIKNKLLNLEKEFKEDTYKVRLLVDLEGEFKVDYECLKKVISPVKVKLSRRKIEPENLFLYHKTTQRYIYERERHLAEKEGFFEVIFINTKGELTEGSISNIFLCIKDRLFTPPVQCGLLPGVFRQYLLERGDVEEKVLYIEDILRAERIFIGNSVRGLLETEVSI